MNTRLSILSHVLLTVLTTSFLGSHLVYAQDATIDSYFKKYSVEFVYSPAVETAFPTWAQPDDAQDNTDLNYRVHEVLPYTQDRNAERYLVYPKSGIVLPIRTPNSEDVEKIKNGEVFNHYPYLEEGGLFYYGSAPSERVGNMVIAAHSSFGKDKPGRYKTIFQALPITRIGDKVFYYEKNGQGSFDFYEYTIKDSFETDKTNVSILKQQVSKETLTTYGCYKIGTNDKRWVNVGELTKKTPKFVTLSAPDNHASAPATSEKIVAPTPRQTTPVTLSVQSVTTTPPTAETTTATPTPPTPLNTTLQAYLLKKKQVLSGSVQTGTAIATGVQVTPPTKPVIEELPVSLRIMYGPVLNRLVYHLIQQVKFHKPGIEQLIEKFTKHYEASTHPTKRLMQGYIIQKLNSFLE